MLHGRLEVVFDDRFYWRVHRSLYETASGIVGVICVIDAASRMSRHCHYRVGDAVMNLELPGLSVYDDDAVVCQSLSLVNG